MTLKIELEVQEVQAVLTGLAKLPLEQSIDAWFKIKTQAEAQLSAEQNRQAEASAPAEQPDDQA